LNGCVWRRRCTDIPLSPTTHSSEWLQFGAEEQVDPNAPVVDGNTAENADDPNTFSEANGGTFSLQNLMEWEENLLSISIDDITELWLEGSPPHVQNVTENPTDLDSLFDNSMVLLSPPCDTEDPVGPARRPTQGTCDPPPLDPNHLEGFFVLKNSLSNCDRFERG